MQRKGFHRPIALTAVVAFVTLITGGCNSEEEDDTTDSVASAQPVNSAPAISGNPAAAVKVGDTYSFTPSATDPDGDALTFSVENKPAWADFDSNTGKLSGQPGLGSVGAYANVDISVTDGKASSALPRFSISVDQAGHLSATLSWSAPTENADGSALTDLAGYRIYWSATPGIYSSSVTIDSPGLTTYVVEGLVAGTYEFVATSLNVAGVESAYSAPVTKAVL